MPWWSWILIWVALVACTLVGLLLGGIYLFRKGMAVMRGAAEDLERVTARPPPPRRPTTPGRPPSCVFPAAPCSPTRSACARSTSGGANSGASRAATGASPDGASGARCSP
ncbi:hypothetical protein [Sinomonas atrocyanea]